MPQLSGAQLLVHLSDHLDLTTASPPGGNGLLESVASKNLPAHAAIFCSLVKRRVIRAAMRCGLPVNRLEGP
jgi:hypothetical protein